MKTNEIFGKNLKYYRFEKGYSQEKLAELANLDTSYLSGLENGKHIPSFEKLDSICKVLNIEVYLLFKPNNSCSKLPNRITEYQN